jgi:hypothetical protein
MDDPEGQDRRLRHAAHRRQPSVRRGASYRHLARTRRVAARGVVWIVVVVAVFLVVAAARPPRRLWPPVPLPMACTMSSRPGVDVRVALPSSPHATPGLGRSEPCFYPTVKRVPEREAVVSEAKAEQRIDCLLSEAQATDVAAADVGNNVGELRGDRSAPSHRIREGGDVLVVERDRLPVVLAKPSPPRSCRAPRWRAGRRPSTRGNVRPHDSLAI